MSVIDSTAVLKDFVFNCNETVSPDDGLADDDSWIENLSQTGDEVFCSVSNLEADHEDIQGSDSNPLDFTLHTIVEESCDDSDLENNDIFPSKADINNSPNNIFVLPSDLESYYFFGLGSGEKNITLEDSSSEIFSDCSENLEFIGNNNTDNAANALDLSTSRLEKYFLSEFMGFCSENKSDGSVGSDSEGQPSPNQRKKKFVRARGMTRINSSSLDSLYTDSIHLLPDQSIENLESSESENNSSIKTENDGCINFTKRKKNVKKREIIEQKSILSCNKTHGQKTRLNVLTEISNPTVQKPNEQKNIIFPVKTALVRNDSFNNWSSDEETNLMMSKMRQFFKTLIALTDQSNKFEKYSEEILKCRTTQIKVIEFSYLEKELVRLMKTVPNNIPIQEQVGNGKRSSQDTLQGCGYLSECNFANIETALKNEDSENVRNVKIQSFENNDGNQQALGTDTVLVYRNLIESLIANNSEMLNFDSNICNIRDEKPSLIAKVLQHIGQKLVTLMHEVNVSGDSNTEPLTTSLPQKETSHHTAFSSNIFVDQFDSSLYSSNHCGNLLRSKSHDILIGSMNRIWLQNSNTAAENGEISDCDRFSWRGSFESALLASGDSRSKLLVNERDSCSLSSELSISKRRSVDNLEFDFIRNAEKLDRVQSCGSIGVLDKRKCEDVSRLSLSGINNKAASDSTLKESIEDIVCTNSLLTLPLIVSDKIESDTDFTQPYVKSARYRSPDPQTNLLSLSLLKNTTLSTARLYHTNNLRRAITSTSLDDFSVSEFSSTTNKCSGYTQQQPHKYSKRCDSLTSINSDTFENRFGYVKVKGQVEFAVQYNYKVAALEIHVIKCKDLAAVDTRKCKSDPYVKVYLLPDKSKNGKRKTKVKKHTLNPLFDETMRFHVSVSDLENRSIWLTVWHSDIFGRNDFLGEVTINLKGKVFDNPRPQWYSLQEKSEIRDENLMYCGDVVVGLKFITSRTEHHSLEFTSKSRNKDHKVYSKGKLHILVKEAKNLHTLRSNSSCDTFCKSYLLPNRTRGSKQKTPVYKKSINPLWNFTFVYEDITLQELAERALELTIWDHDRLISNEFLGGVRFSLGTGKYHGNQVNWMDSKGKELFLWQEMLSRPNFWVEGCVKLRSNLNIQRKET